MRKFLVLLISFVPVLLIGAPVIYAQEATDTPDGGWPIEERCVGAPTKPPKGWRYDGTILMTGYAGIHGVNAQWDTPRVMVSGSPYTFRSGIADGSAGLSPDKKWYATFDSDFIYAESLNHLVLIKAIMVHSTSNPKETYRVEWKNSWLYMWGPRRMLWLDNAHLIYETSDYAEQKPGQLYIINPFDNTKVKWDGKTDLAYFSGYPSYSDIIYSEQYVSPDLKWTLKLDKSWGIYEVFSGSLISTLEINASAFAMWSPNSSQFITEIQNGKDNSIYDLVLFDKSGMFESKLMTVPDDSINIQNASWSPNGDFFAYLVESYTPKHIRRLYVADIKNKRIFDTCLDTGKGVVWSPSGKAIAAFLPHTKLTAIAILDLEQTLLYTVGYRPANDRDSILGWRAD